MAEDHGAAELARVLHAFCAACATHYTADAMAYVGLLADGRAALEAVGWDWRRPRPWVRATPAPAERLCNRGDRMSTDLDTVTLTTHHGGPVVVLNGLAYGPEDMTPAGVTAAQLVTTWAARFAGPYAWLDDMPRNFGISSPAATDDLTELYANLSAAERIAALAPEMLAALRGLLAAYDARRMVPVTEFSPFWQTVRELIARAEGAAEEPGAADVG